jgi:hypothetical protein
MDVFENQKWDNCILVTHASTFLLFKQRISATKVKQHTRNSIQGLWNRFNVAFIIFIVIFLFLDDRVR